MLGTKFRMPVGYRSSSTASSRARRLGLSRALSSSGLFVTAPYENGAFDKPPSLSSTFSDIFVGDIGGESGSYALTSSKL